MKPKTASLFPLRSARAACAALTGVLLFAVVLKAADDSKDTDKTMAMHAHTDYLNGPALSSRLVGIVREQTRQYVNVNSATTAGYQPLFGCVSGPEIGAMGVHYINLALVSDGEVDANRPEALIYEPSGAGMRLVGVEYIVDAGTWAKNHSAPPMLENQAFQLVGSPNRYGLPAFYELHVWAWRDNPNGSFVDWNPKVTCDRQ
jgi:hypothetical protein